MNNKSLFVLLTTFWVSYIAIAQAPLSGAITYQGRLVASGQPANGTYDLQFHLTDAPISGAQSGVTVTKAPVTVSNGLFVVALDFGAAAFNGLPRWLELAVRTNGSAGPYTVLTPRQPVTPTPYALWANSANAAATASTLADSGASLTNFNGANIVPGTISSNQIHPATDAAYRQLSNAITNNFPGPFALGNAGGAHFNCAICADTNSPAFSYNKVILGANPSAPIFPGSSILLPDRGGIWWADGSCIYGWNDHNNGGGLPRNELQIVGNFGIAFTCYGAAQSDGGFQMGASGGYHDKFWFQYDTDPGFSDNGFSKLIQFVTRSGPANTYAYSAIRAVAADTTGAMNTLNFYSGSPSAFDNSGGNRVGTMLTNGWDFRGRLITEHATYVGATTNVIDWSKPSSSEYQAQGNSAVFVTANLPVGRTNNETRVVFIKSGPFAPTLSFPVAWHWLSESGSGVPPTSLSAGKILKLTLTALGPGNSNVLAEARSGPFP